MVCGKDILFRISFIIWEKYVVLTCKIKTNMRGVKIRNYEDGK